MEIIVQAPCFTDGETEAQEYNLAKVTYQVSGRTEARILALWLPTHYTFSCPHLISMPQRLAL